MCFENVPYKALYSGKKWDLERLPNNVGFIPSVSHYCKILSFLILLNPSCIRKNMPAYTCFSLHTQAATHICRPRATLVILFPKIDFYSFRKLYFHFNTSQVNLISNWALNWPWVLEFEHH